MAQLEHMIQDLSGDLGRITQAMRQHNVRRVKFSDGEASYEVELADPPTPDAALPVTRPIGNRGF